METTEKIAHTPGPWWVNNEQICGDVVIAPCYEHPNCHKTIVFGQGARQPLQCSIGPNSLANARLIAAAPAMLIALRQIRETCPADPDTTRQFNAAWALLEAAIAKAEGV